MARGCSVVLSLLREHGDIRRQRILETKRFFFLFLMRGGRFLVWTAVSQSHGKQMRMVEGQRQQDVFRFFQGLAYKGFHLPAR